MTPNIYILVTDFLPKFPLTEKRVQKTAHILTLNLSVLNCELNPTQNMEFKFRHNSKAALSLCYAELNADPKLP